ncbi:hypothetical protein JCM5353_002165, partial [Sporobolomyces roseus]
QVALDQYLRLWSSLLVRGDLAEIRKQLSLTVDSNDQVLEAGLYVDPDFHRSYYLADTKHEATSYLVSAMERIDKSFPSLPRRISLLTPGEPFNDPHCIAIKSTHGPHVGEWLQIPHPSLFLVNGLRLIKIHSDRIGKDITTYEKRQAQNRRNAQARLLRIFVELLDKTGLSNTAASDAIWPVRLHKQRICQDPQTVVEQYLTSTVATDAARWEAGIGGHQNDSRYLQKLYSDYMRAFQRISIWVSEEVRAWDPQPPSCFRLYDDSIGHMIRGR